MIFPDSAVSVRHGMAGFCPHITAPGQFIGSAMSQDIPAEDIDDRFTLDGGLHMIQQGTSMATPHVAGIVALMLQANPLLSSPGSPGYPADHRPEMTSLPVLHSPITSGEPARLTPSRPLLRRRPPLMRDIWKPRRLWLSSIRTTPIRSTRPPSFVTTLMLRRSYLVCV